MTYVMAHAKKMTEKENYLDLCLLKQCLSQLVHRATAAMLGSLAALCVLSYIDKVKISLVIVKINYYFWTSCY